MAKSRVPEIIDNNSETNFCDVINYCLKSAELSKMAVGYFYLSGFNAIRDNLQSIQKLKLLINNELDRQTFDEIQKGFLLFNQNTQVENITKEEKERKKENTINDYANQLEYVTQSTEEEEGIFTLYDLIKQGRVDIRVFTGGRLHAKLYLVEYSNEADKDSKGISFVGSSNLTQSGIKNNAELNICLKDEIYFDKLNDWFDNLWDNHSATFSESLINIIEKSWVKNEVSPYDIYLKTLYHLNEIRLENQDKSDILNKIGLNELYDFQQWAFNDAVAVLQKYNGVFISDVVGLGKSYIASALIKYFLHKERKRTLIICPASLENMWQEYSDEFGLQAEILPMSRLEYPDKLTDEQREDYSLLNIERYNEFEYVVIDESHNFRNKDTQRYKILKPYLEDPTANRKTVLLTATPQNKSVEDILNQFELFHHDNDISQLGFGENDLERYRKSCENDPTSILPLLQKFVIRRRRKDIAELSKSFNFTFPERILENATYNIEKVYSEGVFEDILNKITGYKKGNDNKNQFRYTRYRLQEYLNEKGRNSKLYKNLSQAGIELKGLMKVLLFKRFESSLCAFDETVTNMLNYYTLFLDGIHQGKLISGKELEKILSGYDGNIDKINQILNITQVYSKEYFHHEKLVQDLQIDISVLQSLKAECQKIRDKTIDDKFATLLEIIKKHKEKKILIFSEYAATAAYIHESLTGEKFSKTALVTGDTKDKLSIIERFAPKSNTTLGHIPESSAEINILVTTDVLSEGQNLQDASVIINYDIHWNPVRLIQRIGRVDRIGSEFENIMIYNFLPEGGIEKILRLKERVQDRVNAIHTLLGEDGHIFTADDTFSEESYTRIYVNRDDSIFDSEMGEDSELEKGKRLINRLKIDEPAKYNYIKNLSTGVRCARLYQSDFIYVFAMSDDGVPLLCLHNPNEKKDIINIETVLKHICAASDEKSAQLLSEDKKMIHKISAKMIDTQQRIDNEKAQHNKEKKHLVDRIMGMYTLIESDDLNDAEFQNDYRKYAIDIIAFLENVSNHKYLKKIRDLVRFKIESDTQLFRELKSIHLEHLLEIRKEGKVERKYKIICSEAMRGK